MKREPCILVQWITEGNSGMLIEQLRYAGLVSIVKESMRGEYIVYLLEIRAPRGVDQRVWADQNVARMTSFGLNATASWKEIH